MPTIIKNGRNYSGTSVSLTQAEYDALPEVTKMNGTTYFITDSEVVLTAEDVTYDNSTSGLKAVNVQEAIDENASAIEELSASLVPVSETFTDSYGNTYQVRKYANGDAELFGIITIDHLGTSQGPYNGMYRATQTINYTGLFTSIYFSTANGTNSCIFIVSAQNDGINQVTYFAQSVSSSASAIISGVSVFIKGRWK